MKLWIKFSTLFLLILTFSGCSKEYWDAHKEMFTAENLYMKAYSLKDKKVSYEERLPLYGQACDHFLKAFHARPKLFTLNRIEQAQDSCWRAERQEDREIFIAYEQQYVKEHPTEYEYGDAGIPQVGDNV